MIPIKIKSDLKYEIFSQSKINKLINRAFYYICIILLILIFFIYNTKILNNNKNSIQNKGYMASTIGSKKINDINELIEDNFFIIDSYNLEKIQSIMYGFSISKKGLLTNNYYKMIGYYEEPGPQGIYIMIRKIGEKITINQDFYGSFGLYIYENKNTGFFALSNSFLLLEEYLVGKQNFTFNKEFSDNLIISDLCSPSIYETMVNEIILIPPNSFIVLDIKKKTFKIHYIDYKENSVPFESLEGLKLIDKWVDKWGYIFRSIRSQTNNIMLDLSGGFDTRTVLAILLNSGINLNKILIRSINDTLHCHEEDFKIASNISKKFGFKLNNLILSKNGTKLSTKDSIFLSIYTKLGFHKEFYFNSKFYSKPIFRFSGSGGEAIRGYHHLPIKKYIEEICSKAKRINGHIEEFYNSSLKICYRSMTFLKKNKAYNNDYEITADFYFKGIIRHHFGKAALESFLANIYTLHPLIDPDIKQIKFDMNEKSYHDLIAYIFVRFGNDLINIPFQGKRELNRASIKKAEKLNKKLPPYKIDLDYNKKFYIDIERKYQAHPSKGNNPKEYLRQLFKSPTFINIINQIYDNNVYNWAKQYSKKSNYFPLRHGYGLYAVVKTLEDISLNKRYFKNLNSKNDNKGENTKNIN
jgi:hypothetical protein